MQSAMAHVHELHGGDIGPEFRQHFDGARSLQGDQRAVEQRDLAGVADMLLQVREIGILAGGVDDDEEVVAEMGDHQVVENAAVVIGEETVALATFRETEDIDGNERFQRKRGILILAGLRLDDDLAHVGHVEEAGGGAGLQMFLHDAGRILHRHVIAGEGHHAGAERQMQRMQRGFLEGSSIVQRRLRGLRLEFHARAQTSGAVAPCHFEPPLSLCLRLLSLRRAFRERFSPEFRLPLAGPLA